MASVTRSDWRAGMLYFTPSGVATRFRWGRSDAPRRAAWWSMLRRASSSSWSGDRSLRVALLVPRRSARRRSRAGRSRTALRQSRAPGAARSVARRRPPAAPPDQALVQKYCVTCHNDRAKTGGLSLRGPRPGRRPARTPRLWEKVVLKLRGGMMPPQGMPRPDEATLERVHRRARAHARSPGAGSAPIPGHKPVHRLNRTEYGNAVRDLLDLEIDVAELLPADDESHGFDNIAGVLRISPSLLEQYLGGGAQDQQPGRRHRQGRRSALGYRIPPDDSQEDHVEGLPLGTRGGLLVPPQLPAGRRVRLQRLPAPQHRRLHDRPRVRAPARDLDRRRARVPRAGRRRGGQPRVRHEHVGDGQHDRRAAEDARAR